ncbi:MAG: catecholate siderophore receptor Fiu [Ottowia sp.]|uniref:catecholate siderophore receptor Fiu n=1 Tax=Ottowia sp. TaxID=1898956 RepID=UPI0039E70A3D
MASSSPFVRSRKHAAPSIAPRTATSVAALALVALGAPAQAQTAAATLPEVKVQATPDAGYEPEKLSSPKFTAPLVDTPQTITVIRKEVLQDQGSTTLTDALRNSPGITFQMGENGNTATGDAVYMRGYDTSGSIFVDGVRDVGTITRDVFNLEQVEVVKGPAGADIGRGSPTGYINLSSKAPQADNFGAASLSFGTASQKRATADINRKFSDTGAVRLNLMVQDSGVPGRDHVTNDRWGIAPSVAFGLGTPTRLTFSYLHVQQNNRPDGGLPTIGLDGYYLSQLESIGGNGPRVDTSNYYGWLSDHDKVKADMLTARFEHDFSSDLKLSNVTRWGRSRQDLVLTGVFSSSLITPDLSNPAGWLVRLLPQGKLQTNKVLTNHTNVTAKLDTGGLKHAISAGLELAREEQDTDARTSQIDATNGTLVGTAYQAFNNLYTPDPSRALVPVVATGASTHGKLTTAALYAFDNIEFNKQWSLNAGLRFEHYKTDYLSVAAPATPAVADTALSASGNLLTGKLGVVYKPAENGSIYAAVATSSKPPGSDFALSATATNVNNPNLDPQKATTFEIGTKWELLNRKLLVTAAAFRTTNKNELAVADSVTGEVVQFGKTRVQGVELTAAGQITPAWAVIGGIAYTNAKILEGSATSTGAAVRYSPKVAATLWTTYKLPMGLTFGGGVRHVDTQARSTSNVALTSTSFFPKVPAYTVFDAMVGYEINRSVSLQLNVYNLTNKFYLARVNNAGNRFVLGAPRSFLVTANFKF